MLRNNVPINLFLKRFVDVLVSTLALLLLSPVIALTALLIRARMGSPVLFRQTRPGLYARPFTFYKFRTMSFDCDEKGFLLPDECRLNPSGKFLRRTSLDELPQLWNVLKGDMSLVGPRPLLMEYIPIYTKAQAVRHDVKPGIISWAMVNGRNNNTWDQKFEMDQWYVANWSIWLDIKILLMTPYTVISCKGANEPGCATVSRFTGSVEKN